MLGISSGNQQIRSNVKMRNKNFLIHVINIYVNIDIPATIGSQGKYIKYISFSWPPREATMSVLNLFFVKNIFRSN